MKKSHKGTVFFMMLLILILANMAYASPLRPSIICEGEHGDLVGNNLVVEEGFISITQGGRNDFVSLMFDTPVAEQYELWIRAKGNSSGKLTIYDTDRDQVFSTYFQGNSQSWSWIPIKGDVKLTENRYYIVLSDFTASIELDKVVIKQSEGKQSIGDSTTKQFGVMTTTKSTDTSPSSPILANESPWTKQGLNPFASLLQNGNEFVSTTSGILTISATDLVIPGRGGLDLAFSRYYTSQAHSEDRNGQSYFNGRWDFGFPRVSRSAVYFPNGSESNLNDEEVAKDTVFLGDGYKKIIYTNLVNRYFKLVALEKRIRIDDDLSYEPEAYELFLADGSYYYFNSNGTINYMAGRNRENKIHFFYDSDEKLVRIEDTIGRIYYIDRNISDTIRIIRGEDNKTLVTYSFDGTRFIVQDALNRQTVYENGQGGIKKIKYPSGKVSEYSYHKEDYGTYYLTWVESQTIKIDDGQTLVKHIDFLYDFSDQRKRKIRWVKAMEHDENSILMKSTYYYPDDHGMVTLQKIVDEVKSKTVRTIFSKYTVNKDKTKEATYHGNFSEATKDPKYLLSEEEWRYDAWGNLVYYKDPEGYETLTAYVNTDYENLFYNIGEGNGTKLAFYNNTAMGNLPLYNLPSGQLKIRKYSGENNEHIEGMETYYLYDQYGNLIETKSLSIDKNGMTKWIKNRYEDYDQYGNCRKQIFDSDSVNPFTVTYGFDTVYSAYLKETTQYIGRKNFLNESGGALSYPTEVTTTYDYDFKTGLQTKVTDSLNRSVVYDYDILGRPTKVTYSKTALDDVAPYEEVIYDDVNNKVLAYDSERKNLVVHYFDGLGRTRKAEYYADPNEGKLDNFTNLDSSVETTYNWQSQVQTSNDANGKITTFEYDIFGRQTKMTTADQNVTTMDYNDLARTVVTTNPKNVKKTTYLDKNGQKVKEELINKGQTLTYLYEYDGYGNVVLTTDAKNQQMGYEYNNLGQLIKTKYPDHLGQVYADNQSSNRTVSYKYDTKGNLEYSTNRKDETIHYEYNEYNQPIKIDLPNSTDINYYYNKLSQLVKVEQSGKFKKEYQYDERGRMKQEIFTITDSRAGGSKTYTTEYTFDKNNALTSIDYPRSNGTLTYMYDQLNRIDQVQWGAQPLVKGIDYTKTGQLSNVTYGNNVVGSFNYAYINGGYMPNNISYQQGSKRLGVYDYRYDKLGNILRANNHQYEYDDLGQLVNWKYLKDNERVLLGEEVIWNKDMKDLTGLNVNYLTVSDDQLELALNPKQDIVKVARLRDTGEVASSSSVVMSTSNGYSLNSDLISYNESFTNSARTNAPKTTAAVNYASGTVTIPANQSWKSILNEQPNFQLSKTGGYDYNSSLGSFSPNTSYSGYQFTHSDGWRPEEGEKQWQEVPGKWEISPTVLKDVKSLSLEIRSSLENSYRYFGGGWGNWTLWVKVEINQMCVDIVPFRTGTHYYQEQVQTLSVDLLEKGLVNKVGGLTVKMYWLVNKWGDGSTKGGNIKYLKAQTQQKLCYPINKKQYIPYPLSLEKGINYKLNASHSTTSNKYVEYQLWNKSAKVKTLSNGGTFTVTSSGDYYIRAYIYTENKNYSPTVESIVVSKERKYLSSATVQLNTVSLTQPAKSIGLEYTQTIPTGTSITYAVSNDNGLAWVIPKYDSQKKKYVANFAKAGNKVIVKATLRTDAHYRYTPTLKNVKATVLDPIRYNTSGFVVTKSIAVIKPTRTVILELHGKKNSGNIAPSLNISGVVINGVSTSSKELIDEMIDNITDSKGGIIDPGSPLYELEQLRSEISNKNLQSYYYRFDIPKNLSTTSFNGTLKIVLTSSGDQYQTPTVNSYILLHEQFRYYSSGSFTTSSGAISSRDYTFDQVRLNVTDAKPSGTSTTYYVTGTVGVRKAITPEAIISLGADLSTVGIEGQFSTSNTVQTPTVSEIEIVAVGETPFKNDLEDIGDVSPSASGKVSVSSDCVVGSKSILLDHTNTGYAYYAMNSNDTFDVTKLPIVQIWVKPLTENTMIGFYTKDEQVTERINTDANGDGIFEVGDDLVLNEWNLLLLDFRQTIYGAVAGVAKDAQGLNIAVHTKGTKVLIDGVNSLPLNEVVYRYDQVGNRTELEVVDDLLTTSVYEMGSNRLERRYNLYEDYRYTYDDNGNLIHQDVISYGAHYMFDYVYNELNQLVAVNRNDSCIAEYAYDHAGLRYLKKDIVAGNTTIYVYGTGTEPMYEEVYNNSNLTTPISKTSYLNMGSKRIAKALGSTISYYYTDHLGSTRLVMTGGSYDEYEYVPFGADFTSSAGERYKFTGKEDEGATGLYYFNARYYDPAIGRFVSEDPVKDGVNWYVYAANNPLSYIDKDGRKVQFIGVEDDVNKMKVYLEEATGTNITLDENGSIIHFDSASENFVDIQNYLTEIINSAQNIKVVKGELLGVGLFDPYSVTVKLDIESIENRDSYYWYKTGFLKKTVHYYTGKEVIMHELLGHGLDYIRGVFDKSNWKKKRKKLEKNAMKRTNEMRKLYGIPARTEY